MKMKMRRWLTKLGLLLPLMFLIASPANAASTVGDVAGKLVCQCGCFMVLNNCTHIECASRETMLGIIEQKLSQGQSSEVIVQTFVKQYGEKVLAEPPKAGFNLTAWLFPFVSIAVGAVIITLAIKKWLRRQEPAVNIASGAEERDEEYKLRLERELKEFPERGFR